MAYIPFNGATLSWEGSNYEITSFSMEGGTRAEIDITHSGSTRRPQIPGMASAPSPSASITQVTLTPSTLTSPAVPQALWS